MDKEAQVWQRVFAEKAAVERQETGQMQRTAAELAAVYRQLAAHSGGKRRERLLQLLEGEQRNLAALKGIARLSGQGEEVLKLWDPGKGTERRALEECYRKTRLCMQEYMSRSAGPEFGTVFRILADREAEHCGWLAELLGS